MPARASGFGPGEGPASESLGVRSQQVVHPVPSEEAEVAKLQFVSKEDRMNIHKKASLTPLGRERIVLMAADGRGVAEIAASVGVSQKTVYKWIARFAVESVTGLADRSSRPHRLHRPTPAPQIERIIALRRPKLSDKAIATDRRLAGHGEPDSAARALEPNA